MVLNILKLFAPIMPHITEATYQLYFDKKEGIPSIHNARWPEYDEKMIDEEAEAAGDLAVDAIGHARRAKSGCC